MMTTLTLWLPSKAFANTLNISENDGAAMNEPISCRKMTTDWERIDKHFSALKRLSSLINNLFGTLIIFFMVVILLGYGISIDDLVLQQDKPEWKTVSADFVYFIHGQFITCLLRIFAGKLVYSRFKCLDCNCHISMAQRIPETPPNLVVLTYVHR